MVKHTTNLAERATSIADREAEKVWKKNRKLQRMPKSLVFCLQAVAS